MSTRKLSIWTTVIAGIPINSQMAVFASISGDTQNAAITSFMFSGTMRSNMLSSWACNHCPSKFSGSVT